jgi:uncharacterized protein (DUF433 family)
MISVENSEVVLTSPDGEPLVKKTPGVCGGDACIGNTRIMVWLMVGLKKAGTPDDEIFKAYPTLSPKDLAAAWEYFRLHPEEIEEAIRLNQGSNDD